MKKSSQLIGAFLLGVLILCLSVSSFADDAKGASHPWYCPQAHEIKRTETLLWNKFPWWRSYSPSLTTKLTTFLGAEWIGTKHGEIGQFLCLYTGNNKSNFPVFLYFHSLVYLPTLSQSPSVADLSQVSLKNKVAKQSIYKNWAVAVTTGASGGHLVLNCVQAQPKDCPFLPHIKKKTGDIFKEVEQLRQEPSLTD